jgi:adenylate cyclase
VADRIDTVLWFSNLRDYTRIADASAPEDIIPLLQDYAILSAIHYNWGDVLKLIGDRALAIFPARLRGQACAPALDAAAQAQEAVRVLNERRLKEGSPTTEMYLGLNVGDVFYGNIGSKDRLDVTVVGSAVNESAGLPPCADP